MAADPPQGTFERNDPYSPTPDNRPAPLDASPLGFTRENRSQMSFGERAALEGILAQLRPRLAVEIGTAQGGSLGRIASYSHEVHSIDISHAELDGAQPANVHLHLGPSADVLPPLLHEFSAAGRALDFALVDGDHSCGGVISDLRALLDSPCTARSVILAHDSMNEEIRAGIEQAGLEDYDKVVYFEPDFVPGYIYRTGSARHTVWGGLALIICDTHRSAEYERSPRQWRYYEPYEAIHRIRQELRSSED
jgi:predicted O-methyltransferase YrrM